MTRFVVLIAACFAAFSTPTITLAQDRVSLGNARLFTNDRIGDRNDRWRTGSYHFSALRGPASGIATQPGQLLEYRLRGEVMSPSTLMQGQDDRRLAGVVSLGLHTKWRRDGWDYSAGLDVVAVGPQTGAVRLQNLAHKLLSVPRVRSVEPELPNAFYLNGVAEMSRNIRLSSSTVLRPFAEVTAGPENIARIGADMFIGPIAVDGPLVRDVVTGHLIPSQRFDARGLAFTFGADYAYLGHSVWLKPGTAVNRRGRVRAGIHWQASKRLSLFYGATYLSPEFQAQPKGQVLGSISVNISF